MCCVAWIKPDPEEQAVGPGPDSGTGALLAFLSSQGLFLTRLSPQGHLNRVRILKTSLIPEHCTQLPVPN